MRKFEREMISYDTEQILAKHLDKKKEQMF